MSIDRAKTTNVGIPGAQSSIRGTSSLALVGCLSVGSDGMPSFLSRVQDAEGAAFVGRGELLDGLESLVREADREPRIVKVIGAPGIGKSALVRALGRRLGARRQIWIRGDRDLVDAASFEASIARAIEGGIDALGRGALADVVVIDSFERCVDLGGWLFEEGLVRAGSRLCVVLVSRERTNAAANDWAAVGAVTREVNVPPLSDREATEYLERRAVPSFAQAELVAQAAGYPIALKWMADKLVLGDPGASAENEVASSLAALFVVDAPTPLHVRALLALAMIDVLDEGLLEVMLGCGQGAAARIFAWLAGRAFVDVRGEGLALHGVVRSALYSKLLRSEGSLHVDMASRASDLLLRRTSGDDVGAMHGALMRALSTRRGASAQLRALEIELGPRMVLRQATTRYLQPMAAVVRRWEGEGSERRFRAAFLHDRSLFWVVCGAHGEVLAVLGCVALRGLPAVLQEGDPALEAATAAWRSLDATGAWDALAVRWWMTSASYHSHDPALLSLVTGALFVASRGAPRGRYVVAIAANAAEAEPWNAVLEAEPGPGDGARPCVADLHRLVGTGSPIETAARLARERICALAQVGVGTAGPSGLAATAIVGALREALPKLARPRDLATSPLLSLRAVRGAGPAGLVRVLVDAIADLEAEAGYEDAARLLRTTYLGTPQKQEAAAADLGLPFGTYRHRLRAAITDLARAIAAAESAAEAGPVSSFDP